VKVRDEIAVGHQLSAVRLFHDTGFVRRPDPTLSLSVDFTILVAVDIR
jgi:hypothetical protein